MYHKTDSPKFRVILILPVLSGIMWGSGGVFVRRFDAMGMDNFTMPLSLRPFSLKDPPERSLGIPGWRNLRDVRHQPYL